MSTTRGGRDRTLRALANQCSKPPPDLTPNAAIRSAALSRRAGHVRQSQTKLIRRVVWIITTPLGGLTETLSGGPVLVPWCPGWCRCTPVAGRWGGFVVVVEGRISGLARLVWGVLMRGVWDLAAGVGRGVNTAEERRGLGE